MTGPERAFVLISKLSADTAVDLAWSLRRMADDVEQGKITTGCWGSPSSGGLYSYKNCPEQTHDEYFRQLDEHLKAEKARS